MSHVEETVESATPRNLFSRGTMHREDLWWFFNDAASDLGERSNFASVVALIEGGGGSAKSGPDEVAMAPLESDRAQRAASRWRRIRHTLKQCDDATVAVLGAFHTQTNRREFDVLFPDGYSGVAALELEGREIRKHEAPAVLERAKARVVAAVAAYRAAYAAVMA